MNKQVRSNRLTEVFRNCRNDREILANAIKSEMSAEAIASACEKYLLVADMMRYPKSPTFINDDDPQLLINEDGITYNDEEAAITDTGGGTYFETGNDKLNRVLEKLYNDCTTTDDNGNILDIDKVAWLGGCNYQYADEDNNTTYFFK